MLRRTLIPGLAALILAPLATPALAQQGREIALYSSRHYDTDRELYDAFTRETGIRIRLIEGDADQLIQRIQTEGANSPADVLITVDAARLARAKEAGVLQPVRSQVLESRIPANLRDPEGFWFGVSKRARVIMYDRQAGVPEGLTRIEDLADPRFRGQVCVRAANHPYNTSLVGSILAANGPEATEAWARGVVANMARPPQGGDRDQFRAIPAGQCKLAVSNTYYLGGMATSQRAEDRAVAERIGVLFLNQGAGDRGQHVNISGAGVVRTSQRAEDRAVAERIGVLFLNQGAGDRGQHVNISGAGVVRTSRNAEDAQRFVEYLTSPRAQEIFAVGNMEYPVVADAPVHPALAGFGNFREDNLNAARYAANVAEALRIMQRAGWR